MPELQSAIADRFADQPVKVFAIHGNEDPAQVAAFIEQTGVTFPVVADEGSTLSEFDFPGGVGYPYPRDVVIGKDLTVRSIRNSFHAEEMTTLVEQLLTE